MHLQGQRFLVTGATGRLGCDLCPRLEQLGAEVLPLVLPGYSSHPKRVEWTGFSEPIVVEDIEDLDDLPPPNRVINLHWQVQRDLSFTGQLQYELETNIHQLSFLWDWLKRHSIQSFANLSSIKIFSHLNQNPISHQTEAHPFNPYGIIKQAAEHFFAAHFANTETKVTHLRLSAVASVGEHPSQLMSRLYTSCFENTHIRLNTGHSTSLLYIDEAVDLIIQACLQAQQQRYLLTPPSIANDTIASEFERIAEHPLDAEYVDLMPGIVDAEFISDIPHLQADWIRTTPLADMIKKFIMLNS